MRRAPLLIVPLSHKAAYLERYAAADKGWTDRDEARWPVPYWDIDTGMATLLMLLTAVDEGLAACFFGIQPPQHPTFHEAFGVPAEYTAIGCVAVGYAGSDDPRSPSLQRGRRGVEEVVHRGRW
jgi:nitroreductase